MIDQMPLDYSGRAMFDVREKKIQDMILALAKNKEHHMIEAINFVLGRTDWSLFEIREKAKLTVHPNKHEIFSYDGIELLEIMPVRYEEDGFVMTAKRSIIKLYKDWVESPLPVK